MNNILQEIYALNVEKCINDTYFDYNEVGCEAYGETGYNSFNNIIDAYKDYFNENTIFYDLGSGCGKLVFHVGIMCNAKKSCGIEYSQKRYQNSIDTLNKYNINNVSFINDNFLNVDFSDATVIYLDNTLFPLKINKQIYEKIPHGCIVFSRQMFKESKLNGELIKNQIDAATNYGTNSLYIMVKKGLKPKPCKFDHNGECLICDCWSSDCAYVRMINKDYKYETKEELQEMFKDLLDEESL
jgi:hypothetical protein